VVDAQARELLAEQGGVLVSHLPDSDHLSRFVLARRRLAVRRSSPDTAPPAPTRAAIAINHTMARPS
jgi:hypothetical protein